MKSRGLYESIKFFGLALVVASPMIAQKKPAPPTLADRYEKASCTVVQIVHDGGMGTGFFISADGDVLTAAHVALNRVFSPAPPNGVRIDVDYKAGLRIVQHGQASKQLVLPKLQGVDVQRATADLVVLRTGLRTACYLTLSTHPEDTRIGQHVIAIGFPISAPSGALYEGFISAKYQHLPIPMAIVGGVPIYPTYDVIRVQMPITPGASGGPIIVDDGDVIGVITENPTAWFNDLNSLIQYEQAQQGGFNAPESDVPKMMAKLAWVVQQFVTSGAGLAVPISYLAASEPKASPPALQKTEDPAVQPHRGWFRSLLARLR
jgi:S1-C subfamily serine protease